MASGDGLLIRVKPFGGRLVPHQLRTIGEVAESCGNGTIELTSRGNLQMRGLTERSVARASASLVAAGLADPDPARERRRNVIAVPPCDDALVARIEAVLAETEGLAPKFCVVVRDGGVAAGGVWQACGLDDVEEVVRRIVVACLDASSPAGARLPAGKNLDARTNPSPIPSHKGRGEESADPPPLVERDGGGVRRRHAAVVAQTGLISPPFGQTNAPALRGLAALIGDAVIRTTPWRAFQIEKPLDPRAAEALGFIADRTDPRLSIAACPGAPACASATVPARADAAFLAALGLRDLHVSGCAKGCAHRGATTTLVGRDGRYDLIRHGRAGDVPDLRGLTREMIAEALS
jgi:precorrin-3B synthase